MRFALVLALVLAVHPPCRFTMHGRAPFAPAPFTLIALTGTIGSFSRKLYDISENSSRQGPESDGKLKGGAVVVSRGRGVRDVRAGPKAARA